MNEEGERKSKEMVTLYNMTSARLRKMYDKFSAPALKMRANRAVKRSQRLHGDLRRRFGEVVRGEASLEDYRKALRAWYCQLSADLGKIPRIQANCRQPANTMSLDGLRNARSL